MKKLYFDSQEMTLFYVYTIISPRINNCIASLLTKIIMSIDYLHSGSLLFIFIHSQIGLKINWTHNITKTENSKKNNIFLYGNKTLVSYVVLNSINSAPIVVGSLINPDHETKKCIVDENNDDEKIKHKTIPVWNSAPLSHYSNHTSLTTINPLFRINIY